MRRPVATVVSVLVVLTVLSPALLEQDSYPLSTYPMFSHDRGRIATIPTAVGYRTDGTRVRLSPSIIGGGIEVIHAAVTVDTSIRRGDTAVLCREIAVRATARRDLARIEVVSEVHDVVAWFDGDDEPRSATVHASCEVPR